MFELGRTYVRRERFNDGAAVLKRLVDGYPQSPFAVSALSELGLIYQNLGKNDEALKYYKKVVDNYPSSPQVKDAMIGIKNIYVDKNDVDTYFAFAKQSGIETNVTVVERDSLSFMAANRVYQSRDYTRALPLMDNYLRQYPQRGLSGGCAVCARRLFAAGWKPCGGVGGLRRSATCRATVTNRWRCRKPQPCRWRIKIMRPQPSRTSG